MKTKSIKTHAKARKVLKETQNTQVRTTTHKNIRKCINKHMNTYEKYKTK